MINVDVYSLTDRMLTSLVFIVMLS